MALIVQKYGGSSVGDADKIKHVAARIIETQRAGNQVCVVVSAMGDTTDELLDLANQVSANPEGRELDMLLTSGERISMALLSMAINDLGAPSLSFTGSQAGIITDEVHGNARIATSQSLPVSKVSTETQETSLLWVEVDLTQPLLLLQLL